MKNFINNIFNIFKGKDTDAESIYHVCDNPESLWVEYCKMEKKLWRKE